MLILWQLKKQLTQTENYVYGITNTGTMVISTLVKKKLVILFIYLATPIVHGISQDSNKLTP